VSEIFEAGTSASGLIFDGILEYQKQRYFGKDISLTEDVYPLLQNEYLLSIDQSLKEPKINLLLELQDRANDLVKIEKLVQAFTRISGIFAPHLQEVTLPDGSKGQEIIADAQAVTRSDETYQDMPLVSLKIGNLSWGIYYAVVDKYFILSTDKETLKKDMDRVIGKNQQSFKNSQFFQQQLDPLIRTADQVAKVDVKNLTNVLGFSNIDVLKPYLEPFQSLVMAKNFFDDGISTIYSVSVGP